MSRPTTDFEVSDLHQYYQEPYLSMMSRFNRLAAVQNRRLSRNRSN